jgi:hypothetical protein
MAEEILVSYCLTVLVSWLVGGWGLRMALAFLNGLCLQYAHPCTVRLYDILAHPILVHRLYRLHCVPYRCRSNPCRGWNVSSFYY